VRVQVLTNAGALDRDKQLAVVSQFTELVSQAASSLPTRWMDKGMDTPWVPDLRLWRSRQARRRPLANLVNGIS
jgi:hypothetical protein